MARREHCTVASWAKPNRTVGSESERELGVGRLFDNKISEQIFLIIVFLHALLSWALQQRKFYSVN